MATKTKSSAPKSETFYVNGKELRSKVEQLIHEGNIRRIIIKNKQGDVIVEFPMTVGVIGTVVAPVLAAVGGLAALLTECSITVERR